MASFNADTWADVVPVAQDDGPTPVVAIMYSDYYKKLMGLFRAVVMSAEHSERALDLTKLILDVNAANYTVWQYRRACLLSLGRDLSEELDYMDSFSEDNPKNYQIWHHRRVIAEHARDGQRELDFTNKVFAVDAKNYHGWAHRQWVLAEFQLWEGELEYIDKLLEEDVRNNSVWNQRWFVVHNGPVPLSKEIFNREVDYTFARIALVRDNESSWNYLRGLLLRTPEVIAGASEKGAIFDRLKQECAQVDESANTCRHLYALTADLCEKQDSDEDRLLGEQLLFKLAEQFDCIRKKYWFQKLEKLRRREPRAV